MGISPTKHYDRQIDANTYEGVTGGKPYRIRWVSVDTGYVNGIKIEMKIHGGAWQGRNDKNHHVHRGIVEAMHS